MGKTLTAGLLGFAGGFAQGKADQGFAEIDAANAEALRLRKEEAAILKERRLLRINTKWEDKVRRDRMSTAGQLRPDGSPNVTGLDPDLAKYANEFNLDKLQAEQIKRNEAIRKEDEKILTIGADTTVSTGAQTRAKLDKGEFRTAGRGESPAELRASKRELKAQLEEVIQGADNVLKTYASPLSDSERTELSGMNASIDDIKQGEKSGAAFTSLTMAMARNAIVPQMRQKFKDNPAQLPVDNFDELSSTILQRQELIAKSITTAAEAYKDAMRFHISSVEGITNAEKATLARKYIAEGIQQNGEGPTVNIRDMLRKNNMWNESINNIMFQTMDSIR